MIAPTLLDSNELRSANFSGPERGLRAGPQHAVKAEQARTRVSCDFLADSEIETTRLGIDLAILCSNCRSEYKSESRRR